MNKGVTLALIVLFCYASVASATESSQEQSQVAFVASEFQLSLAEHYGLDIRALKSDRENVRIPTEFVSDPADGSGYTAAIATAPLAKITVDAMGATAVSYNPIYDVAWVAHFTEGADGNLVSPGGLRFRVDGLLLVTGDALRGTPLNDLKSAPNWARAGSLLTMTNDYLAVANRDWSFSQLESLGSAELLRQRTAADWRILAVMKEQIDDALSNDPTQEADSLKEADKILACAEDNHQVAEVDRCFKDKAGLALATTLFPSSIDAEGYRVLLGNLFLAGTVKAQSGNTAILFASKVPLQNKYALAIITAKAQPVQVVLIPLYKE